LDKQRSLAPLSQASFVVDPANLHLFDTSGAALIHRA
jgi:hypothetical protein